MDELDSFCESQLSSDYYFHNLDHTNQILYELNNPAIFIFKPIVPTVFIHQIFDEKQLADWILVISMQALTIYDPDYQH